MIELGFPNGKFNEHLLNGFLLDSAAQLDEIFTTMLS